MSVEPAAAIAIRGLRVVRGGRVVIPDLSVEVSRGLVTGLLGPSGSGKTTLMRAIVGVQRIQSGAVEVLGEQAGSAGLRSRVGYLTQAPAIYGDLTVRENLDYFGRVLNVSRTSIERVLETVDLTALQGQVCARLSGGEVARVSLATAMLNEPELLVLDEPTVGLDPELRAQLWRTFHDLAQQGTSLLVSSHVMDEAARCDRLLLLRDGEVLAAEALDVLLSRTGADDVEEAYLSLVRETERTP